MISKRGHFRWWRWGIRSACRCAVRPSGEPWRSPCAEAQSLTMTLPSSMLAMWLYGLLPPSPWVVLWCLLRSTWLQWPMPENASQGPSACISVPNACGNYRQVACVWNLIFQGRGSGRAMESSILGQAVGTRFSYASSRVCC